MEAYSYSDEGCGNVPTSRGGSDGDGALEPQVVMISSRSDVYLLPLHVNCQRKCCHSSSVRTQMHHDLHLVTSIDHQGASSSVYIACCRASRTLPVVTRPKGTAMLAFINVKGRELFCNLLRNTQSFVMLELPTLLPNRELEIRRPRNADRVQRHVLSTDTTQAVCHAASNT